VGLINDSVILGVKSRSTGEPARGVRFPGELDSDGVVARVGVVCPDSPDQDASSSETVVMKAGRLYASTPCSKE
jgi:hypothetical protein